MDIESPMINTLGKVVGSVALEVCKMQIRSPRISNLIFIRWIYEGYADQISITVSSSGRNMDGIWRLAARHKKSVSLEIFSTWIAAGFR